MKFANLDPESQQGLAGLLAVIRHWYKQAALTISYSYEVAMDHMPASRVQIAHRLLDLALKLRAEPANKALLRRIEAAATSHHRFKRCYALDTLGRLGSLAKESVPTQIEGLLSDDPFVREAAAQALFRMGPLAMPATNELARALANHVTEGTARYAVLALGEIGDASPETLNALEYAATAENSYAAEEAANLYNNLSRAPRSI